MSKEREFYTKLLKIALPITLQSLIVSSLNMFDTVMVGTLGEEAVAAVGIANQFFFLLNLILLGVSGGCSIYISQFWGKRDNKNIKKIVGIGTITASILGIIFTLMALIFPEFIVTIFSREKQVIELSSSYLRIVSISYIFTAISIMLSSALKCMEKTIIPMCVSFCAVMINIVFNYILVFGKFGFPVLGVDGSAVATVIARIIEFAIILYVTFNRRSIIHGKLREYLNFDFKYYLNIIRDVLPVVINESCWALATISYSIAYGFIGTSAQASIQICNNVQNLFMVVTFGLASGSLVIIGNTIGAGDNKKAKFYAKKFYAISIIVGIILGLSMVASTPIVMKFFKVSNEVVYASANILKVMAMVAPFRVFNIVVVVGILRGGGDVKKAMYIEVSTMWLIGVPMAFLGALLFKFPVEYVVGLTCLEEVVKFILCVYRLKSDKWIRRVV